MRVVSNKSTNMVYHRKACRYVQKISMKNLLPIDREEAERRGYRPCKCCDGIKYLYDQEADQIKSFAEKYHLDVNLKDYKVYVRTDVGCWKIVYKKSIQKFILLHRNYVDGRIRLEDVDKVPFHRQGDRPESGSIMKYLKYIKNHDLFKQNLPGDYRQMPKDTKKQKEYYRAEKRKAQRRSARRLDNLFVMIEQQEGIKSLSFC